MSDSDRDPDDSVNGMESLTSAFQEPVPSPLDDLPPASYWPDGALPPRPSPVPESSELPAEATTDPMVVSEAGSVADGGQMWVVPPPAYSRTAAPVGDGPATESVAESPTEPIAEPVADRPARDALLAPVLTEAGSVRSPSSSIVALIVVIALLAVAVGGCGLLLVRNLA